MTLRDDSDEQLREQFWEIGGLKEGQTPDFGILVLSYIDYDGQHRFNWRVAAGSGPVETDAVIELLENLAASVKANEIAI